MKFEVFKGASFKRITTVDAKNEDEAFKKLKEKYPYEIVACFTLKIAVR